MKFNVNLITIALLANAGAAMAADGYGIADANTGSINMKNWKCSACKIETGASGQVGVGVGYNDSDDIHSANTLAAENDVVGKVDADIRYRGKDGYQAEIKATNLGMENGRAEVTSGKIGKYKVSANYRQIATYSSETALTPYAGIGSDYLSLPSNWVAAGASDGMTALQSSLSPFELSLKRKRYGLGFEYQADQLWSTFVHYQREDKTGVKTTTGSIFNQAIMLPEPVDYSTDTVEAGIKLKGDHWFTALTYNGSFFRNDDQGLGFDSAYTPTFGGATAGYKSLDPDNDAHTISLSGQYSADGSVVSGRLMLGRMTQDQNFVTSGYSYTLPEANLDAEVDITGMDIRAVKRINSDLRISGSYNYYDRDNKTDVYEWTQISVNNVTGNAAYNTPYDSTVQKGKLAADYRIISGVKLTGGYDYRRDERNYTDREVTDENSVWARLAVSALEHWNMSLKGSYGKRDGSDYEASQWTSSEANPLLRKYYLANRDRKMVEARVTHTPLDNLTIDLGGRYALDDYSDTTIGLTESREVSYDASINYQVLEDLNLNLFYNHQTIKNEQAGAANFSTVATWFANTKDKVDVVGAGVYYDNLLEKKLRLGLDYTYSKSDSTTKVRQGVTGDYGDYFAKEQDVNAYAQYQATEKVAVRLDYKMVKYEDNDAANDLAVDGIWNLVSFGDLSHDYTAHLVMLSVNYKL
ncbi:MtrB/PioB family decaheme-associated outer membrane protein [Shewanella dokdonensis]|uniref:MtrB/PioB family decaheme-associated outer membrane protein n=1 Tax=Shewanella dokdonensis TaxID=712036 RepID=UPI00200E3432|nr:MtrB/PioB family decaheme-associated outer membrane protein [Shewanella dokdonensis]MCL1075078.1 MtrB/PioB family decaheme-associated outer membrane protein [Shewanella dokdonensis]